MSDARGVDLEIYDPSGTEVGVIKPTLIRINGVDCLTPEGKPAVIEGLLDKGTPCTATVTFFVRSLQVHGGEFE